MGDSKVLAGQQTPEPAWSCCAFCGKSDYMRPGQRYHPWCYDRIEELGDPEDWPEIEEDV